MLPTLAVASSVLLAHLATQPTYPGFGQPFTVSPPKVRQGLVFVRPGQIVTAQSPATACGMTILKPETDVDPKIVIEPPKNDYKIRVIEPERCR